MAAYDFTVAPPGPIARVTIADPEVPGISTDISMLIDSGAEVSVVPAAVRTRSGSLRLPTEPAR